MITRWYRPPELLYGARHYSVSVDTWSIGCIAAELLLRVPFLQGTSDLDQLSKTFETLGSPTPETWPDVDQLPDYVQFNYSPGFPLTEIFTAAGDDMLDLLRGLFALDPKKRLTSTQCLSTIYNL